jgi:branched-chain amino acid transport system ATP-binding protein
MNDVLLEVRDLHGGYGASQVLFGMHLALRRGQCVSLMGRNGMGKSTTVKTIMGMLRPWRGTVRWQGRDIHGEPVHRTARAGIGLVPEGRQVFPNLSVRENLVATAIERPERRATAWTLGRVYALFPRLRERAANFGNQLSGGEQQMLAIGRALMTNPELLILDEATEGLSPLVREEVWRALSVLKADGMALLVIDKHVGPLTRVADEHHVIEKGRVVWQGDSERFAADPALRSRYLGA